MGMWTHRQFLGQLAFVICALFISVLVLHVLVPHEHQHEYPDGGLMLPLHASAGEKYFSVLAVASIFSVFFAIAYTRYAYAYVIREMIYRPGVQKPQLFLLLFSSGILHSRAY